MTQELPSWHSCSEITPSRCQIRTAGRLSQWDFRSKAGQPPHPWQCPGTRFQGSNLYQLQGEGGAGASPALAPPGRLSMRWHPSLRTAPSDCSKSQVSPALHPQAAVHLPDHLSWAGPRLSLSSSTVTGRSWWGGAWAHQEASTSDQLQLPQETALSATT